MLKSKFQMGTLFPLNFPDKKHFVATNGEKRIPEKGEWFVSKGRGYQAHVNFRLSHKPRKKHIGYLVEATIKCCQYK